MLFYKLSHADLESSYDLLGKLCTDSCFLSFFLLRSFTITQLLHCHRGRGCHAPRSPRTKKISVEKCTSDGGLCHRLDVEFLPPTPPLFGRREVHFCRIPGFFSSIVIVSTATSTAAFVSNAQLLKSATEDMLAHTWQLSSIGSIYRIRSEECLLSLSFSLSLSLLLLQNWNTQREREKFLKYELSSSGNPIHRAVMTAALMLHSPVFRT